jgi:hypothetical protein
MTATQVPDARARSPERILSDVVNKQGRGAKQRRKLAVNRERNWLLTLVLNSFSRLAARQPLSDLESLIADAFRTNGYADRVLVEHGRLYDGISAAVRQEIFPARFARLSRGTSYSSRQLQRDAPGIVRAVLAMPNVTRIDTDAIHAGHTHQRDVPVVTRDVVAEHGAGMLVALSSKTASGQSSTPSAARSLYSVRATSFRCNDATGADTFGSDKPYWVFGVLGDTHPMTTRSQVFEDVGHGRWLHLPRARRLHLGPGLDLRAGEHAGPGRRRGPVVGARRSRAQAVQKGVAAVFAAAACVLAAVSATAWMAAVVAGAGAVTDRWLSFLDDDHVADQTFALSRDVLDGQLGKAGNTLDITRRFTDGDGDYTLTITTTRVT